MLSPGRVPGWILDGWERRWPRLARTLAFAAAFGFALYLLFPFIHNDWDLIDDHEVPELLLRGGPPNGLRWYLNALSITEGAHPGGGSRYRPAYYFLRITETWLFRSHVLDWYISRALMFGLALALLLWVLERRLSLLENLCLVGFIGTYRWWADVYGRLGPAEAYAGWGLALYALGALRGLDAVRAGETRARPFVTSALALFFGGAVCGGSKESFVLLLLPSLYVAARARWAKPRRWLTIGALGHIAFTLFVAVSVAVGVKLHGHVYHEDVSFAERLGIFKRWLPMVWTEWRPWVLWVAGLVALGALSQLALKRRDRARAIGKIGLYGVVGVVILGGAYLSQVVFYNGAWPPGMGEYCCGRYSYPGMLVPALALWLAWWCLVRTAAELGLPEWLPATARLAAVVWAANFSWQTGFPVRAAAAPMVARRESIQHNLESIVKRAKRQPELPIIMVANDLWDYERVYAVPSFLRMYGVWSTIYLVPHIPRPEAYPAGLERWVAEQTYKLGTDGGQTISPFAFHGGTCLGVGFHGMLGDLPCEVIAHF